MKKALSVLLAMTLLFLLAAGSLAESEAAGSREIVLGVLSLLNLSEEDYVIREQGRFMGYDYLEKQGVYVSELKAEDRPELRRVVFYNRLLDMVMGLQAGDITSALVPVCTADYLCAQNDMLKKRGEFHLENADDFSIRVAYRLGVGYGFLTTEDKAGLRDELDQAIAAMKEDGTLDALVGTYIANASSDPEPVQFTKTDGETIRVAVTGELPPMDYVAPDGTPAGFNTALLAELGRRLNKNFELVLADSAGRSAALASGKVDLVFWTSGTDGRSRGGRQTAEDHAAFVAERDKERSEEQNELMRSLYNGLDYEKIQNMDIPDGTVATKPYFSDLLVAIGLKN